MSYKKNKTIELIDDPGGCLLGDPSGPIDYFDYLPVINVRKLSNYLKANNIEEPTDEIIEQFTVAKNKFELKKDSGVNGQR